MSVLPLTAEPKIKYNDTVITINDIKAELREIEPIEIKYTIKKRMVSLDMPRLRHLRNQRHILNSCPGESASWSQKKPLHLFSCGNRGRRDMSRSFSGTISHRRSLK